MWGFLRNESAPSPFFRARRTRDRGCGSQRLSISVQKENITVKAFN
jgi:hypothetical protein